MLLSFTKYVGGKSRLASTLVKKVDSIGADFKKNEYFEPFCGSAVLFFQIGDRFNWSTISDRSIATWSMLMAIRHNLDELNRLLKTHQKNHCREYFMSVRSTKPEKYLELAAKTLYMIVGGFNGLYRENAKGQCNTPYGNGSCIFDYDKITECSTKLFRSSIYLGDFSQFPSLVEKGDLVYFDPPYIPVSKTANFSYGGFTMDDQRRLANAFKSLSDKGVFVMLSNSDFEASVDLYKGFNIDHVRVARTISCKGSGRGKVGEIIVTNW